MKKVLAVIILGCCLIVFCIFHFSEKEKPSTIPLCNVMNESYFTNDPRYYEKEIPDNYELYGIITYLVDDYDRETDLSTNYDEYMNKEVCVDKNNTKNIYLKCEGNKYLKLYFESEN